MILFILCIAVLNLGLGYGLAVYLQGQGKLLTWGVAREYFQSFKLPWFAKNSDEEIDEPPPPRIVEAAKPTPAAATVPLVAPVVAVAPQPLVAPASELVSVQATTKPRDDDAVAAMATLDTESEQDSTVVSDGTVASDIDELAIATAVEGLKAELGRYRGEVTNLNVRLRGCEQNPSGPTVRSCADDLRKANNQYLERQEAHRGRIDAKSAGDQTAPAVRALVEAVDRQAAAIAAAQAELTALDQETNLLVQCRLMLDETRQISETSEALHATLGAALAAIAPETVDRTDEIRVDASNARRKIAGQIEAWWKFNPDPNLRLSVALIDPDHLGRLNEQHGQAVVDQALGVFGRTVSGNLQPDQMATRPARQAYLLLLPNLTPREAINLVERCRQQIDARRFQYGDEAFRLTVSFAVTQTARSEDAESLVVRLEAMLNEAKRYGRNRTFFQDGSHPSPAVPPALAIESQVVHLEAALA